MFLACNTTLCMGYINFSDTNLSIITIFVSFLVSVTLTHLKDARNAGHLYEEALKLNKLVSVYDNIIWE